MDRLRNGGPARRTGAAWGVGLALCVVTLAVYGQAAHHEFVNYDDYSYVIQNDHVNRGWSREGLVWAFTTTVQGQWHPLTWLSHMTDCELFGLEPGPHHLASVVLHLVTTLLLFGVLGRMTGSVWRSGFVAALFALHPLHVETVAWVSDRKDVLAGLFWMLALWGYVAYAERPGAARYLLVAALFALGLMSKSSVVTLPLVLLLLDFWPLQRLGAETLEAVLGPGRTWAERARAARTALWLVAEKVPLLIVGYGVGRVALASMMESYGDADASGGLGLRGGALLDTPVLYATYLWKTFWPRGLALPYGRLEPSAGEALVAASVLVAVTAGALVSWRRRPYLVTGWLWYLVTLVPVVGLLRSGPHHLADRYTYLPLIGLFLAGAWLVPDLTTRVRDRRRALAAAAAVVVLACSVLSWRQMRLWRDSATLFRHTLAVTEDNHEAHNNLGVHLVLSGRVQEAGPHFAEVVRLAPSLPRPHFNLGNYFAVNGRLDEAAREYRAAIEAKPDYASAYARLASTLAQLGRFEEALEAQRRAVALAPSADGHYRTARILQQLGEDAAARDALRRALALDPEHAKARAALGGAAAPR